MGVAANYTEEVPSKNWVEEENVHSIINGSAEGNKKNGRNKGNKRTPYDLSYYASGNPYYKNFFILVIPLMTWISIIDSETQVTRRTSNLTPNHKSCTETQILHIKCCRSGTRSSSTNLNHKFYTETEVINYQ
jgi:hypothetical protein